MTLFFNKPLPVILAPMAGITDAPFRRAVQRFSADAFVVSEMISSEALVRQNKKTFNKLVEQDIRPPKIVQLVGTSPQRMAEAAKINADLGADILDINMGCPAKKVVNGYAGSALMKDEQLAASIVNAVVNATPLPVTVKMRTGWDHQNRNAANLAKNVELAGASVVTVHGRTRSQFYSGNSDWDFIKTVKESVNIPVIVNGDIVSEESALEALQKSGADGLMVGRAALGAPWLIDSISHFLKTGDKKDPPSLEIQMNTLLTQFSEMLDLYGERSACLIARKHICWYSKGFYGSSEFRLQINQIESSEPMVNEIKKFYNVQIQRESN